MRVAIVDNQTLDDYEIETSRSGLLRNNIYRGVVANVAPSLNAAFVDFGDVKNGFLAFNDVVESAYCRPVKDAYKIADVLVPGQEIIVQVIKDAAGPKGAQVTTNISLAGRYLVLRPKDAKSGVSRKVDEDARADLTQKVRSLDLPEGYGCIVRTNAMDQSRAVLLRDAKVLVQLWHKIEAEAAKGNGPQLLYNDQDIVVSVMRDYFDSTIHEVLIDDKSCYERAMTYVKATIASGKDKIHLYEDKMPIFSRFGIEKQIDQIYARTVSLPGGGYIVIDPTEALTAIDVNSAHATKRENQDLTAYHTNLEAATEIGRQLRMRDIGGLIVVDFIDMRSGKHQRDVERVMRNAMARDKARNKVERISANGLLEINRQRISQALSQRMHLVCPTCGGRGSIPSAEAIGMNLMREIDARAANGNLGGVVIKLHPDIAQQLQNERRREFAQIENEYDIHIEIVATREMSRGEEAIEWLTKKQTDAMRPEKTAHNGDAATIIDVAEVYQNQDEIDDAYRPNDYEEFSSEDARRKRASRRALKNEENSQQKTETESSSTVSSKREELTNKRDARQDADKTVKNNANSVTGNALTAGLLVLATLIEAMPSYMNDNASDGAFRTRRRRFSARKRMPKKSHESGLCMDYRMFVLDLAKAVCVHGLDVSSDVTRREMIERFHDIAAYLFELASMHDKMRMAKFHALRDAISSRHASARLSCLFDLAPTAQADEMATTLMVARDSVIPCVANRQIESGIAAAKAVLKPEIEKIFETQADAAIKSPNGEENREILDDAIPSDDANETENVVADPLCSNAESEVRSNDAPNATERENRHPSRQERRRERRRPQIFESSNDETRLETTSENAPYSDTSSNFVMSSTCLQVGSTTEVQNTQDPSDSPRAQEEPIACEERRMRRRVNRRGAIGSLQEPSPYIVDNEPIVTSDVTIEPMTPIRDTEERTEEITGMETTQEMPAVSRARRARFGDAPENAAPTKDESDSTPSSHAAQNTDSQQKDESSSNKSRERRRTRTTRRISETHPTPEVTESLPSLNASAANAETQAKDEVASTPKENATTANRSNAGKSALSDEAIGEILGYNGVKRSTRRVRQARSTKSAFLDVTEPNEIQPKQTDNAENADSHVSHVSHVESTESIESRPHETARRARGDRRKMGDEITVADAVSADLDAALPQVETTTDEPAENAGLHAENADAPVANSVRRQRTRSRGKIGVGEKSSNISDAIEVHSAQNSTILENQEVSSAKPMEANGTSAGDVKSEVSEESRKQPSAEARRDARPNAGRKTRDTRKTREKAPARPATGMELDANGMPEMRSTRPVRKVNAASINLDEYHSSQDAKTANERSGVESTENTENTAFEKDVRDRTRRTRRATQPALTETDKKLSEEKVEPTPKAETETRENRLDSEESAKTPSQPRARRTRRTRPNSADEG